MAAVYLVCGKLCCGKSTYAEQLKEEHKAVILSADEIMLAVFGLYAGEKHDEYAANVRAYLFEKSLEFIQAGVSVILDWGFWTKDARREAKAFYQSRSIECQLHYLDISDAVWRARIDQRNRSVLAGKTTAYIVDSALAAKFEARFEPPARDEIDVWVGEETPRQSGFVEEKNTRCF